MLQSWWLVRGKKSVTAYIIRCWTCVNLRNMYQWRKPNGKKIQENGWSKEISGGGKRDQVKIWWSDARELRQKEKKWKLAGNNLVYAFFLLTFFFLHFLFGFGDEMHNFRGKISSFRSRGVVNVDVVRSDNLWISKWVALDCSIYRWVVVTKEVTINNNVKIHTRIGYTLEAGSPSP